MNTILAAQNPQSLLSLGSYIILRNLKQRMSQLNGKNILRQLRAEDF